MPDLTPHEEYAIQMGDCHQCGATHGEDMTEQQCAVDVVATDRRDCQDKGEGDTT